MNKQLIGSKVWKEVAMESKILTLAKKLKALSDRGVGGEKENATMMLERLMEKHNISFDDIEEDKIVEHELKYSGKDKAFCYQVISSVLGSLKGKVFEYKTSYTRAKVLLVNCTESDYLLINAKIDFYWDVYQKELDIFYSAFIQKNKLWRKEDESSKDDEDKKPLTDEEKERLWKMLKLMDGMVEHRMEKMLEG